MRPLTRREAVKAAAAAVTSPLFGASRIDSRIRGVVVGVQCYSFRDRPLDAAIKAMVEVGCGACEMNWAHLEPPRATTGREQLRQWRTTVSLDAFEKAGAKVRAAGIDPWAYTYNIKTDFTEAEMNRGFEMTRAMGAHAIICSANISVMKQIDTLARKHKIHVALHNHSRIVPDELATPADLAAATQGLSDYIGYTLDIGHFVAAGFDPIVFLEKNHRRILSIHVKDRKRDQGPNVPLGQGDTPVREVLRLIRDRKYDIKASIEYEYKGDDTLAEVRKCFEYCKQALLT